MKKYFSRLAAAAIVAVPMGAAFTTTAKAEDTGMLNALDAQTRAQVEAYKKGLQKGKASNPRGLGAGIRG